MHEACADQANLRRKGVRPQDMVSLELGVPTPVLRTIAEPVEAKVRPESGYHAAFSGPSARPD